MKRYNQGFLKFGPMEQCDDGEWIKYEGHEKVVKDFLKAHDKMSEKLKRKVSLAGFTVNELSGEKEPLPEGGAVAAPAAAGGAPVNPASPFGAPKKEEKAAH